MSSLSSEAEDPEDVGFVMEVPGGENFQIEEVVPWSGGDLHCLATNSCMIDFVVNECKGLSRPGQGVHRQRTLSPITIPRKWRLSVPPPCIAS